MLEIDEIGDIPLVSVVIATNRVSPFLAEALGSVAAQTHPLVETIVVDDGSPDPEALATIVQLFEAQLIRTAPTGVSAARNLGASVSAGGLLVFLDDDDRWHPERLTRQVASMATDPDAVAGYCGIRSIDEQGREIAAADDVETTDRYDIARRRTGILMGNLMVRRDAFEAVGGLDHDRKLAEDLDLVLKLAGLGRFTYCPGALVDYRKHPANSTHRHRDLADAVADVLGSHRLSARKAGDDRLVEALEQSIQANQRFAWWAAARAARTELASRRIGSALSELLWAMRFAPFAPFDALWRRLTGRHWAAQPSPQSAIE